MTSEIHLTRSGYEQLELVCARERQRLAEAVRVLHDQLDNTADVDDGGLETAKLERMRIEAHLTELEETLARARIVDDACTEGRVTLGSSVVLIDADTGRQLHAQLVSAAEASVLLGGVTRVSDDSPVGRELLGRAVGETFTVHLGRREVRYHLKAVGSWTVPAAGTLVPCAS